MSRWGKPTRNKKHKDPRYFLNESIDLNEDEELFSADTAVSKKDPEDDGHGLYGPTRAAEENPEDDENSLYGKTNAPQEKQNLETRLAKVENVLKQLIAKLKNEN
jgi:hypothetical protein